jgi:hypothetical protein
LTSPPDDNPAKLTVEQRLTLLERDDRDHARILTELVQAGRSFTDEQLTQIRHAFREELAEAGLRLDEPEHQDAAREDFRFVRRLRLTWDGAVSRVGNAVLLAFVGVLFAIIGAGFWAWLSSHLPK